MTFDEWRERQARISTEAIARFWPAFQTCWRDAQAEKQPEIDELQAKNKQLKRELQHLKEDSRGYLARISELEAEIERLPAQAEKQLEIDKLKTEVQDLEANEGCCRVAELLTRIQRLLAEIERLTTRNELAERVRKHNEHWRKCSLCVAAGHGIEMGDSA